MRDLFRWIGRFGRDRGGNMAVIFALTCVPLLTAVGCALDYSRASQIKSKLQSAIDAASVGSVARRSPAYLYAGAMSADGPIAVGVQDAKNIFNANMQNMTGYTLNDVTPVVARSDGTVTSKVTFSADVPTMFLGVIGQRVMTVTGSSTSTANMPLYADFYLLLDNSPSMGVGATPADVQTMVITPRTNAPSPATTSTIPTIITSSPNRSA
jgi:Flp pilus assembly protein TadG